jgi:hypothetical protein
MSTSLPPTEPSSISLASGLHCADVYETRSSVYQGSIAGILMVALSAVYERQRRTFDAARNAYENTRMCQRCGTFYLGRPRIETNLNSSQSNLRAVMLGFFILLLVGSLLVGLLRRSESGTETKAASSSVPLASEQSDEFSWPTEGLPTYIANALKTPYLEPPPGTGKKLVLGTSGQTQSIATDAETASTGSGGPFWYIRDSLTQAELLEAQEGLHKTDKIANGYYDLLLEGKWGLYLYEYRQGKYVVASCYERSNGLGSPARPAPCQGEAEPSASPKASMGYPVPEETFVNAYVLANSGRDDLSEVQLTQLAHDEYKMGMTIDTQTLLLGGGMLNTRGKRAMDYLDKLDRQQHQTQSAPGTAVSDGSAADVEAAPVVRPIGGSVSPPSWLHRVEPELSEDVTKVGNGGSVLLYAIIDENGYPTHIRVLRSLGAVLDGKAVAALRQSTFHPALDGGKPVQVELNIEVPFKGAQR